MYTNNQGRYYFKQTNNLQYLDLETQLQNLLKENENLKTKIEENNQSCLILNNEIKNLKNKLKEKDKLEKINLSNIDELKKNSKSLYDKSEDQRIKIKNMEDKNKEPPRQTPD